MTDRTFGGNTLPFVDDLDNGSHVPYVRDRTGAGGVRYTTDTTPVTAAAGAPFAQIMCLTATTFAALTRTGAVGSLVGVPLPAGTLLVGPFTAYTLTSGAVAAYL